MCLGPSEKDLKVMGFTRRLGNQTETVYAKFPLCSECWKKAFPLRVIGWAALAALVVGGSLVLARFKDDAWVIGFGIPVLVAAMALVMWYCLVKSQPGTVGWMAPQGVSEELLHEITGWKRSPDGKFALIAREGALGYLDTFYLPLFRNQAYQALFEKANGLKNPFGLTFGPELTKRITEEARKRRGSR
jgi:hypothetical protein